MFKFLLTAYLATQAGDSITTTIALHKPLMYEENRFISSNLTKQYFIAGGITTGEIILATKLRKEHPKVSFFILGFGAGVEGFITARNIKKMR